MSIIGTFPVVINNGDLEDATVVMQLFSFIQSSVNGASLAASGANSDITSLSGLTTPIALVQGGTGVAAANTAAARAALAAAASGANSDITSLTGLTTQLPGAASGAIGVGQTYQAAAYAINTTYTNNTGRPIIVGASGAVTTAGYVYVQVAGVNIIGTSPGAGAVAAVQALVPAGATFTFASPVAWAISASFVLS